MVSAPKPTVLILEHCPNYLSELLQTVAAAGFEGLPLSEGHDLTNCQSWPDHAGVLVGSLDASLDPPVVLESLRKAPRPVVAITETPADSALRCCSTREAISLGVQACLPRRNLATDLQRTLATVLQCSPITGTWAISYTFDNVPEVLPIIVSHVRTHLEAWPFSDPMDPVRMTVALSEVLDNALYHGNLELSSDLRQGDGRNAERYRCGRAGGHAACRREGDRCDGRRVAGRILRLLEPLEVRLGGHFSQLFLHDLPHVLWGLLRLKL